MNFNARIGPVFPRISKTMLFDCRSADDVCAHLEKHHDTDVQALLCRLASANGEVSEASVSAAAVIPSSSGNDEWPDLIPIIEMVDIEKNDVAIIGMSGRFPGAANLQAFWNNLLKGYDAVSDIPAERWSLDDFYAPDATGQFKSYAKRGAFLDNVDRFDSQFFGISSKDAATLDPQCRIFLECAWHALEDAALLGERADAMRARGGPDIGVFVGVTTNTYSLMGPSLWSAGSDQIPNSMPWYFANRLSYALNFSGPSLAIDTACSSSLVALHVASTSLRNGECRAAVVGGVNLYLHPAKYIQLCQQHMLSRSGRCSAFGQDADGFVPGEGVGAVVLKTMRHAIEDGDKILATIRGSAVRHGGRTNGFTVPSPISQQAVIEDALKNARVSPGSISYIEAHGTGTKLGDPIEVDGLRMALGDDVRCGIGSVKSNIGHLELAAGIASVLKLVMQLRTKTIAPTIHAEILNPALTIDQSQIFVTTRKQAWMPPPSTHLLRGGVSSFGAGGTNCHVIIEEAPERTASVSSGPLVFPLSAQSDGQLFELAQCLRNVLNEPRFEDGANILALAYTLQCGRKHFEYRFAAEAVNASELRSAIDAFLKPCAQHASPAYRTGRVSPGAPVATEGECSQDTLAAWITSAAVAWSTRWINPPAPIEAAHYPFAPDRHWIGPAHVDAVDAPKDHGITLRANDSFVRDHEVADQLVVPAASYLSYSAALAKSHSIAAPIEIANAAWSAPAIMPPQGELRFEARVNVNAANATAEISVASVLESSTPTTHFTGRLRTAGARSAPATGNTLDAARKRCQQEIDVSSCYRAFVDQGINYGPSFRCLDRAWTGDGEAIVELRRRQAPAADAAMPLDPAMLDGVLQSAYCALRRESQNLAAFVPFGAKSIRILEPVGEFATVHVSAHPNASAELTSIRFRGVRQSRTSANHH